MTLIRPGFVTARRIEFDLKSILCADSAVNYLLPKLQALPNVLGIVIRGSPDDLEPNRRRRNRPQSGVAVSPVLKEARAVWLADFLTAIQVDERFQILRTVEFALAASNEHLGKRLLVALFDALKRGGNAVGGRERQKWRRDFKRRWQVRLGCRGTAILEATAEAFERELSRNAGDILGETEIVELVLTTGAGRHSRFLRKVLVWDQL